MTTTMKKVKFRPLEDRVLLKRIESEEKVNGIILPDSAKKKQESAEVIALGPGKKNSKGEREAIEGICQGDIVLLDKYSGQEVEEGYVIVRFSEIVAVMEK